MNPVRQVTILAAAISVAVASDGLIAAEPATEQTAQGPSARGQAAPASPLSEMAMADAPLDLLAEGVENLSIEGRIEGENIRFTLRFDVDNDRAGRVLPLAVGDVVLEELTASRPHRVGYDRERRAYQIAWSQRGPDHVEATFAARPRVIESGAWREARFEAPAARVRELRLLSDRRDLEVRFPGALRQERSVEDGRLTVTALLGAAQPFIVRWKPQVQKLDGDLVLSSRMNAIARLSTGALRLDTLLSFNIAQGQLRELALDVPGSLSVTQVRGRHIRDWRIEPAGEGRRLTVVLNQPLHDRYELQVVGEMPLGALPVEVSLPVVRPAEGVRASGQLAVGADGAIRVVVRRAAGLSQIDESAFVHRGVEGGQTRPLPGANRFFYDFASGRYELEMSLEQIVPAYDAAHRVTATVREDDLIVDAMMEMDVRDAPLRTVDIAVPEGLIVATVGGEAVDDHSVLEPEAAGQRRLVRVRFAQPVLGRTVVALRLELGSSPLGRVIRQEALSVVGAGSERGYVVIAVEEGVELERPTVEGLREVHTASTPMRVAEARFAYRIRSAAWALELAAARKPPSIRAEAFHLVSLGEGSAYGSVTVSYYITGAPLDELSFIVPEDLEHVEFVGRDVRRWQRRGDRYTVKLSRKVSGDYNLGLFYRRSYERGRTITVGAVEAADVQTHTGYIVLASDLNLRLEDQAGGVEGLLAVDREELPANYRLLVGSPLLRAWKYVQAPHRAAVRVEAYERGELLDVVIELMQLETRLAVGRQGEAESVTRVRYKVKNLSSQFLTLAMPAGARVWSTHLIETDAQGNERRRRVVASFDGGRQLLMIPLKRQRNPNEPSTVELEYGVAHGPVGWSGEVELTAPRSLVRSTFAGWTVRTPEGWSAHAREGGSVAAEVRAGRLGDLGLILGYVRDAWAWAARSVAQSLLWLWVLMGAAGAVMLVALVRRPAWGDAMRLVAALALLILGVAAMRAPGFLAELGRADDLTTLRFAQPLTLDDQRPMRALVSVVPAWRQHATLSGAVIVPAVAAALLLLAVRLRRLRRVLWAAGLTGLLYAAAQFDVVRLDGVSVPVAAVLGHLLTWGTPLLLLGYLVRHARFWRLVRRAAGPSAATAALLLAVVLGGCAGGGPIGPVAGDEVLQRVACRLTAEEDSMRVEYELRAVATGPMRIRLLGAEAILLSPTAPAEHAKLVLEEGHHWLRIDRRGDYSLELAFLAPLEEAGADLMRRFAMPLPPALTNRVELTVPRAGLRMESPTAIAFEQREAAGATVAEATFAPGGEARFVWRPRARQTKLEQPVYFAEVLSVVRFEPAAATGRHLVRLQIAQGELTDLRLRVPQTMTVTAVSGPAVGAWRYDPADGSLEVRLSRAVSGDYELRLVTQTAGGALPWSAALASPVVEGADRQRGAIGLSTTAAVYLNVPEHPQAISVEDFARWAAPLLGADWGIRAEDIRHAFRTEGGEQTVTARAFEVLPEIRAEQAATLAVSDERLVFNGELAVEVAKAGVFAIELRLPAGYDIDTLSAPQVSHWDERVEGELRIVSVHFRQKLLGAVTLKLTMSRPLVELPPQIEAPRVRVVGAVKHGGRLLVSSERGLRLSVRQRRGLSELNPAELGIRDAGVLVLRLLRPDWRLVLGVEAIEPRITMHALHTAQVSEGLVRHTHHLRYQIAHAGVKVLNLRVPGGALGLQIVGPEIANLKEVEPGTGRWRVELSRKWYDQAYPLTIRYEKRFEMDGDGLALEPVIAEDADLYRGQVAVRSGEKVELTEATVGPSLRSADPRSIPRRFGAGDLSDAVLAYTTVTPSYTLRLGARRHEAADLLTAEVLAMHLTTVVNERGQSIHRVEIEMRVGSKRHLTAWLPDGAAVWALTVNRRATLPSLATDPSGRRRLLIPLAASTSGELPVRVDLTYVVATPGGWRPARQRFEGPRFDLPLKDIRWTFYVPRGYRYGGFEGTLSVDDRSLREGEVRRYDLVMYEREQRRRTAEQTRKAIELQSRGRQLAQAGQQYEAKRMLESAYNYSFGDAALNEDAMVQLHRLTRQQAMVGLKSRRAYLRPGAAAAASAAEQPAARDLGDRFSQAEADRELGSLDRADSENLQRIADRIIAAQEAAAGAVVPLDIHLALHGRRLEFARPLQVEPDRPMVIAFEAEPMVRPRVWSSWLAAAGLFAALTVLLAAVPWAAHRNHHAHATQPDAGSPEAAGADDESRTA